MGRLWGLDTRRDRPRMQVFRGKLADLHATSAGLRPGLPTRAFLPKLTKKHTRAGRVTDMAAAAQERIRQLTQAMLRKKLYVILSKGGATPEQLGSVLPEHLEFMIGQEKRGVLFASGPLSTAPGQPLGDGLTVLRASSADEALDIASADPFVTNGIRTFEVREWTVMEGSLGVRVNFSDQSVDVA